MDTLTPCDACARHVRSSEPRCPFCDATMHPPQPARVLRPISVHDVTRAVIFAGAALLAPACGNDPEPATAEPPSATLVAAPPLAEPATPPVEPVAPVAEPPAVVFAPIAPPPAPSPAEIAAAEQARAAEALALERLRVAERRRVAAERRRQQQQQQLQVQQVQVNQFNHMNARPYGAPPRRDEVV